MQTEDATWVDKAPTIHLPLLEDKRATKVVGLPTGQGDSKDEPEDGGQGPGVQKEKVNPDKGKDKRASKKLPMMKTIEGTGNIQLSILDSCGRKAARERKASKEQATAM